MCLGVDDKNGGWSALWTSHREKIIFLHNYRNFKGLLKGYRLIEKDGQVRAKVCVLLTANGQEKNSEKYGNFASKVSGLFEAQNKFESEGFFLPTVFYFIPLRMKVF